METEDIRSLIDAVDASSVKEVEFSNTEYSIRISKLDTPRPIVANESVSKVTEPAQVSAAVMTEGRSSEMSNESIVAQTQLPSNVQVESTGTIVKSPIVGVAYLAPSPDKDNYKEIGDAIKKGETLCIVEAMKLMNEIPATADGKVGRIFVEDGDVVEYDQPLFEII